MKIARASGVYDIAPADAHKWRAVRDAATETAESFGYQPIETPLIEPTELFERTIGAASDIVNKEMFTFQPRGGDKAASLTLRPEGTASVCRAYLESRLTEAPQPVRLYYNGAMFRYERPQKGRYRQFQQFGIELIGDSAPAADAEAIELAYSFLRRVMPSREKDLVVLVNSLGSATDRAAYVEKLRAYYGKYDHALTAKARERLRRSPLRLLDALPARGGSHGDDAMRVMMLHELAENAPRLTDEISAGAKRHFDAVCKLLEAAAVPFKVDHKIVRGLDYYNDTVFEIGVGDFQAARTATLIGGGRYDGLIELLGGAPTPAVGFAAGLERIIAESELESEPQAPLLTVVCAESHTVEAYKLASEAREKLPAGAVVFAPERSLKSQLRYADKLNSKFALIVGAPNAAADNVIAKDMRKKDAQTELAPDIDKIVEAIAQ